MTRSLSKLRVYWSGARSVDHPVYPQAAVIQSSSVSAVLRSGVFGSSRVSPPAHTSHPVSSLASSHSDNTQVVLRRPSVSAVRARGAFGLSVSADNYQRLHEEERESPPCCNYRCVIL